ncbi:MAG: FtsX-like permease family protein [Firmicutes bacterium]|nr:FtsX-like permease family protein [Bacillota bacterium]
MNSWEGVRLAWKAISSNKVRSFLTMLGIIIGVGAVIILVSVGQGATAQVTSQIQSLGSNLITVVAGRQAGGKLYASDAAELVERVPSIERTVPSVTNSCKVKWHNLSEDSTYEGTTAGFLEVRGRELASGRFLTDEDNAQRQRVAVLGQTVVKELFENTNPVGETIMVSGEAFTVIGTLASKGSSMGQDQDDTVIIPVSVAQRMIGSTQVSRLYVQARSAEDAAIATQHITAIYVRKFGREDAIRAMSQDELLSTIGSMTQTMTMMLGAIASISLVVGGIGIMNIMLVSVSERTREIGIRKAVGAKNRDVLFQFLVEAVVLSLTGGLVGIILGFGGSRVVSKVGGWPSVVSPSAVAIAFVFAAAIGLFFGVWPAAKASALDPIEALRRE